MSQPSSGATYESAGVSIEAGDKAVERDARLGRQGPASRDGRRHRGLRRALRRQCAQGLRATTARQPADGVGTKVAIAQALDKHDTIGFDLVGMLVDDLVVCGAEPLFLTDYIATGRVVPERIAAIVKGIAEACVAAGCALVGGESRRAPRAAGARRVRRRRLHHRRESRASQPSARVASVQVTSWSRWPRAACTPTATPWCATCSSSRGDAASTSTSTTSAARSVRSPRADPHLCRNPPELRQAHRDPRDVPHHRRRPGGQPRAGAAGRVHRLHRPVQLVAAARLQPRRGDRRGWPGRTSRGP